MKFTADTATYDMIEGAHVVGLAIGIGADVYLILQRSGIEGPDDWGIYIELNDQANSGYGLVRECRIGCDTVEIDLNKPLAGVTAIKISLAVDDVAFNRFLEGMKDIFRDYHNQLKINIDVGRVLT